MSYPESDHVYVLVHSKDKRIMVRASMQDYIKKFDTGKFFRVHRSFVVNVDHIRGIDTAQVIVKGVKIPIGKSYRDELLARVKLA